MYRYDEYDQQIVNERVDQYRDQVRRRLSGELTEQEFLPLRLQNGLYMQIHGYMLRIAVPYGFISSKQMRMFAHIARKYDRGMGISQRARTFSLIGSSWKIRPICWLSWHLLRCMLSKHPEIVCVILHRMNSQG